MRGFVQLLMVTGCPRFNPPKQMSNGCMLCAAPANKFAPIVSYAQIGNFPPYNQAIFAFILVAHRRVQRDAELGIVAETALQMQQEYLAKAVAISSELSFAGIDAESLPPNVAGNVNCLVSFAASIGCEDCNEATLCCALEELEQRRVNVEDSLAAEHSRQQVVRDCTSDVSIRLQEVRRVVEGLASDTEKWEASAALHAPKTSQMEEKCRDYTQRLIALKSQLASVCSPMHLQYSFVLYVHDIIYMLQYSFVLYVHDLAQVGARPEIYHEALVRMGHELVAIQKQVRFLLFNFLAVAPLALYHSSAGLSLRSRCAVQAFARQA
jgi:hypothetical protein